MKYCEIERSYYTRHKGHETNGPKGSDETEGRRKGSRGEIESEGTRVGVDCAMR